MNEKKVKQAVKRLNSLLDNVPRQIRYTGWFNEYREAVSELNRALEPENKNEVTQDDPTLEVDPE